MSEDLWAIRRRKKMNVKELAARSGVSATSIHEYESGKVPIRNSDMARLARALYVDPSAIKRVCAPKPRDTSAPSRPPRPASAGPGREARPPRPSPQPKPPRPPEPVRPSQIEHLLTLARAKLGLERPALEAEAGKPLEQLTRLEASALLNKYQKLIRERQEAGTLAGPALINRHRARLPEGVDEFELNYLTQQQQAGAQLDFTLFDGTQVRGRVAGFGPYTITLQQDNAEEITLNKMAIAYYRKGAA
jgi:transcriptional regulator with XRE-family HTH domain